MFAVVKTGGKQYRVAANDVVKVARVAGEPGDVVTLENVLLVQDGDNIHVGANGAVEGASVAAEIVSHGRDAKVIAFKKRRRQNSKRKRGHRQEHSLVRITEILTGGAKASGASASKASAKSGEKAPAKKAASKKAAASEAAPAASEA